MKSNAELANKVIKMDEVPDDFRYRLRTWRHTLGLNQSEAAKILKCERSYLSQLEGKRKPGKGVWIRFENEWAKFVAQRNRQGGQLSPTTPLRDYHQVGSMPLSTTAILARQGLRHIPILSWAQAGEAQNFEQMPEDYEGVVASDVSDESAVAVRLQGDSMEPRFEQGDIAIILPSIAPTNGEVVVANLEDEGVLCKLMHVQHDKNLITLTSYNQAYPPMQYKREDFLWMYPVAQIIKVLR
ncbi:MAG: LexA family transcriptional regulator [Verrucomicrobiota bacterium]